MLAEAGVVDAGGRGLLVLLDALTATLTGHAPQRDVYLPSPTQAQRRGRDIVHLPQFEVMYLLGDCDADGVEKLRARLDDSANPSPSPRRARGGRRGRSLLGARPRR